MGFKVTRKTFEIGYARGVTLPKAWLDFHGKQNTSEVTLIGDAILVVAPKGYEQKAQEIVEGLEKGEVILDGEQSSNDLDSLSIGWPPEDGLDRTPSELAKLLGVPGIRVRSVLREKHPKPKDSHLWGKLTPEQQHDVRESLRKAKIG